MNRWSPRYADGLTPPPPPPPPTTDAPPADASDAEEAA
jgi:hypothetical protein